MSKTKRSKAKVKSKKFSFLKPVHLQAIIFLLIYNILSKTVFIKAIVSQSIFINFLVPYFFGVLSGFSFLYLLKHEDFFHFMKDVENQERGKEKIFLDKYLHHGKVLATLIIASIGGPIFAALTIRLILPKYKYQLALIASGNIVSTLISVGIAKGFLGII